MLHETEDRISDDLTSALTRTIRRWFGDPRRGGLERVTETEVETICQLASAHVSRLARAGWVTEGRRSGWYAIRIYAAAVVGIFGAFSVTSAAHYALDFDGDGRLTVTDAHAFVDAVFRGTTKHIPIRIKRRDGQHIVVGYSYAPDPWGAEIAIEDSP